MKRGLVERFLEQHGGESCAVGDGYWSEDMMGRLRKKSSAKVGYIR